jgi:hypothetical protein
MFNQLVKDAVGKHEEERRGQVAREGRMEGAMAGHARATGSEYTNSGTYSNGTHGPVIDDDANLLFIIIDIVWTGCLGVGNRYTGEHSVKEGSTTPAFFADNFGKGSWRELLGVSEDQTAEEVRGMASGWVKGAIWQADLAVCGEEGRKGGGGGGTVLSKWQQQALAELVAGECLGKVGRKNITLELFCGMGKTAIILFMATVMKHQLVVREGEGMQHPLVVVVYNVDLALDLAKECRKRGFDPFVVGGDVNKKAAIGEANARLMRTG